MARAKHRHKGEHARFVSLVKSVERAQKHSELLQKHVEHRRAKARASQVVPAQTTS